MNLKTYCFIFARGGSKGIPRKNLLPLAGLPLLAHSIKLAQKLKEVDAIYVSTDCSEIRDVALHYGAEVINRPDELAQDTSPEWQAWQHAIKYVHKNKGCFDRFLSIPTTAPLRAPKDVQRCLQALKPGVDIVLTMSEAHRSPWFNMVTSDESSRINLVMNGPGVNRRQDAPKCYDLTTIAYVARPEFVLKASSMWDGNAAGIEVPIERSIDIDTPLDFSIARFLMETWSPSQPLISPHIDPK